jgi:hypothetical protein
MKRRTVHFGTVHVYEFPIILGDNPSVLSGAPIALGCKCHYRSDHSIDSYELCHRAAEEGADVEVVSVNERERMLLKAGYNIYQIGNATRQADMIKKQRLESLQSAGKGREQMALFVESASRALKRMVLVPDVKPAFVGAKTA